VVLDVFSRKVVGWQMADTMTTDLVLSALEMGLWRRDVVRDGLIHHSDKGSQCGFNRSSQHLDRGGADGATGGVDDDGDRAAGDAVAGAAANSAGA
jgi:putative transposase